MNLHPQIAERLRAQREHEAHLDRFFRPFVLAALDAADVPPDSVTGKRALSLMADAAYLVQRVNHQRWNEPPVDLQLAAVDIVIASLNDTARGVRTIGGRACDAIANVFVRSGGVRAQGRWAPSSLSPNEPR